MATERARRASDRPPAAGTSRLRGELGASVLASAAALLLVAAIYLGSRGLRNFDSALVGYAVAIVFLTFGVVYR